MGVFIQYNNASLVFVNHVLAIVYTIFITKSKERQKKYLHYSNLHISQTCEISPFQADPLARSGLTAGSMESP